MIGDLQDVRPKLVVLAGSEWDDMREPNDSALSGGVTLLDDYIHREYEEVAVFGRSTILQLKM
jgi:hypothetical protein